MGCRKNGQIARWTTPTIRYKPRAAGMSEILEIYMTVKQKGAVVIQKSLEEASVCEEGYSWLLSQEETGMLTEGLLATVQVDYKTRVGLRYTTHEKSIDISGSARNEVF